MWAEFTAIFELDSNGDFAAFVAEIPDINTAGKTLQEARAQLAEKLQQYLEHERSQALGRASSNAHIEPLRIAMPNGHTEAGTPADLAEPELWPAAEADLLQVLLQEGLIDKLSLSSASDTNDDDFEPVPIEGKPISQEIIEERQ